MYLVNSENSAVLFLLDTYTIEIRLPLKVTTQKKNYLAWIIAPLCGTSNEDGNSDS